MFLIAYLSLSLYIYIYIYIMQSVGWSLRSGSVGCGQSAVVRSTCRQILPVGGRGRSAGGQLASGERRADDIKK